jgi:hypothetical protein
MSAFLLPQLLAESPKLFSILIMNLRNPHVIWATVAIVFMLIAGSVTLVAMGRDATVVLTLSGIVAVPVLAGFGATIYQKVDQTKEIANGNLSRMFSQLLIAHQQNLELAKQLAPPAQLPASEADSAGQ